MNSEALLNDGLMMQGKAIKTVTNEKTAEALVPASTVPALLIYYAPEEYKVMNDLAF